LLRAKDGLVSKHITRILKGSDFQWKTDVGGMDRGWIKLYRKIQDNPLWEDKPFSKGQAWIDIMLMANHSDKDRLVGSQTENIKRGCLIVSEKKLMERWGWSKNKVRGFLNYLENENMIKKNTSPKRTGLNLVNYSIYQDMQTTNEPQMNYERTANGPKQEDKELYNINNIQNGEEIKERQEEYTLTVSNETVCQTDVRRIVEAWNELESYGIKPISRLSRGSQRHARLLARIKQYSVEDVLSAIDRIKTSEFLQGKGNRGWTITFDWFVLPNNFPKVLDGNYDNSIQGSNSSSKNGNRNILDEWRNA